MRIRFDLTYIKNRTQYYNDRKDWLIENAGNEYNAWTAPVIRDDVVIFFVKDPEIALMFKLTWGGQ